MGVEPTCGFTRNSISSRARYGHFDTAPRLFPPRFALRKLERKPGEKARGSNLFKARKVLKTLGFQRQGLRMEYTISSFLGYLEAGGIFRKLSEDIGTVQDAYAPTLVAYSERKRREKPDVARNSKFFPFQAQLGEKFGTLERKRRETMFSIHDLTKNHVSRNTLN